MGDLAREIERVEEAVTQIAVTVREFVKSTKAITGMTPEVRDIADQTNLLVLNAAIEAARAGEQGCGFAVVADEVRKLAENSAHSASQIDTVTSALGKQSASVECATERGLQSLSSSRACVEGVLGVLSEANAAVSKAASGVDDIASSVREQGIASTDIARNVECIARMAEENHAAAKQTSQAAAMLEGLAANLQGVVERFRV